MFVLENNSRHPRRVNLRSAIPSLIARMGTSEFETALSETAQAAFQCKHLTAFGFRKRSNPRVVGLYAIERGDAVRNAAQLYTTTHWSSDPSNMFRSHGLSEGQSFGVILSKNDIQDEDFRRDCYTKPGISHRLSVLTLHRDECVKISLHRAETAEAFNQNNVEDLLEHSQLLVSLLVRHCELVASKSQSAQEPDRFDTILASRCPQLTNRERRVCSLIAMGMNSEAISLTLDVSINTILTFRRRAYARLNISTQNELMRLLYRDCIH